MFVSLSKTIGRVGGVRIGVGKRITSQNAWWMFLALAFVYLFKLMWYMIVFMCWCMYAMFYGMWWLCKAAYKGIVKMIKGTATVTGTAIGTHSAEMGKNVVNNAINNTSDASHTMMGQHRYCAYCGNEITPGNKFCIKCGKPVG